MIQFQKAFHVKLYFSGRHCYYLDTGEEGVCELPAHCPSYGGRPTTQCHGNSDVVCCKRDERNYEGTFEFISKFISKALVCLCTGLGSACDLSDSTPGRCTLLTHCNGAQNDLQRGIEPQYCFPWRNNSPKIVCCAIEMNRLPTTTVIESYAQRSQEVWVGRSCYLNTNEAGRCEYAPHCPEAYTDSYGRRITPTLCGRQDGYDVVCCKNRSSSTYRDEQEPAYRPNNIGKLLQILS